MTVLVGSQGVTNKQINFIYRLAEERVLTLEDYQRLRSKLSRHCDPKNEFRFTPDEVHAIIQWMFRQPKKPVTAAAIPAEIGVYERDKRVYVVRKSRGSENRYALEMIPSPPRVAKNGATVNHDFKKLATGMVWRLTEEDRITSPERLSELMILVGECLICGHAIWSEKSVRRTVGPRCAKKLGL